MDISTIQPFVRFANFVTFGGKQVANKMYDYRIFYVLDGRGTIIFNDAEYKLAYGTLFIHPPDMKYQFWWDTEEKLKILSINFDLSYRHSDKNKLILPDSVEVFDRSKIIESMESTVFDNVIYLNNMQMFENDLLEIHKENSQRKIYYEGINSTLLKNILLTSARILTIGIDKTSEIVHALIDYIHANYMNEIDNMSIAKILNYHPYYLNKLMKIYTRTTLHHYIMSCRVNAAVKLLVTTDLTVADIALQCGFKNQAHFSTCFKKITGKNPSDYKVKKMTGDLSGEYFNI